MTKRGITSAGVARFVVAESRMCRVLQWPSWDVEPAPGGEPRLLPPAWHYAGKAVLPLPTISSSAFR